MHVIKQRFVCSSVVRLDYPFETLGQPPAGISVAEYARLFSQSRVYVIGTAHFR